MEQKVDPWVEDREPPVPAAPTGTAEAFASLASATSQDERDQRGPNLPTIMNAPHTAGEYAARLTPRSMTEAEQMLLLAQYDFEIASEDCVAAMLAYNEVETQQARTKVRVIEKLMSNNAEASDRVQNAKKKEDGALSFTAAEKIASGHPEYTAIRDQVAEKLNAKTEAERRCAIAEQRVLTLRQIVENRRRFGALYHVERDVLSGAPLPRSVDLKPDEAAIAAQKDSRALQGIERIENERPRFRPPATVFGHERSDGQQLDDDAQRL